MERCSGSGDGPTKPPQKKKKKNKEKKVYSAILLYMQCYRLIGCYNKTNI